MVSTTQDKKEYNKIITSIIKDESIFDSKEKYTNRSIESIKKKIRCYYEADSNDLERMLFYIENNFLDNKKRFEIIFDASSLIISFVAFMISSIVYEGINIELNNHKIVGSSITLMTYIVAATILSLLFILIYNFRSKKSDKYQAIQIALIELIEENKNTK